MDKKIIENIRLRMENKSNEELLSIWTTNNRDEYSSEAFEAIKQIMEERTGKDLPCQKPPVQTNAGKATADHGFFSFRIMFSRTLIQLFYVIGAIGLLVAGTISIVDSFKENSREKLLMGIGLVTVGNIFWRVVCEGWILFFNIHDILVSIERKLDH